MLIWTEQGPRDPPLGRTPQTTSFYLPPRYMHRRLCLQPCPSAAYRFKALISCVLGTISSSRTPCKPASDSWQPVHRGSDPASGSEVRLSCIYRMHCKVHPRVRRTAASQGCPCRCTRGRRSPGTACRGCRRRLIQWPVVVSPVPYGYIAAPSLLLPCTCRFIPRCDHPIPLRSLNPWSAA